MVGAVPARWEVRRLRQVGRFFRGCGGTREDEVESCIPCVRYGDRYTLHQFFVTKSRARIAPELTAAYIPIQHKTVHWVDQRRRRWAFTLSNASSLYFEDRCDLKELDEIDWSAIEARDWRNCQEGNQADFLIEQSLPWSLVRRGGVRSPLTGGLVRDVLRLAAYCSAVEIMPDWDN